MGQKERAWKRNAPKEREERWWGNDSPVRSGAAQPQALAPSPDIFLNLLEDYLAQYKCLH